MSNMLRRMTCLVRIDAITINWNDTTYLGKRVPFAIAGILVNTLVEENPIIACCLSVRAFSCDDVKSRTAEWNEATSPYSRTVLRHQHNSTEKMFITSATTRGQNAKELDFSKFLYSSCIWGPLGVYTSEFGNGVWFWENDIRLSVLTQHRSVSDRQTERPTNGQTHGIVIRISRASYADAR